MKSAFAPPALALALALSACATARLHSQDELNRVGATCGLALGELIQDESEKRLLFLFREQPTASERACVLAYARKNKMRAVFINAIAAAPEG